jgi:hypothetical protein
MGTLTGVNLLHEMSKWRLTEEILSICHSWTSESHLEVEDILKLPMITHTLNLIRTEHSPLGRKAFLGLLERLQKTHPEGSAAAVLTRPPEIVAIFSIKLGLPNTNNVFVLFDSHPRQPKHPTGAAFIFFSTIEQTADYLNTLFAFDHSMLEDEEMQWQVQLLANLSSHVFVSRQNDESSSWDLKPIYAANVGLLEQKILATEAERREVEATQETARLTNRLATLRTENARIIEEIDFARSELERLRGIARARTDDTSSKKHKIVSQFIGDLFGSSSSHEPTTQKDKSPPSSTSTSPKREKFSSRMHDRMDADSESETRRLQRQLEDKDRELEKMRREFELFRLDQERRMQELERRHRDDSQLQDRDRDRRERTEAAANAANAAERRRFGLEQKSLPLRTHPESESEPESEPESDDDSVRDMSVALAHQLQREFNDENERLLRDKDHATDMAPPTFECVICMDHHPLEEIAVVEPCGHQYCRDTLRQYIITKLQENWFPVLCPICMSNEKNLKPSALTGALAEEVGLSEDEFAVWISFEIAPFAIRVECPKCKRPSRVDQHDYKLVSIVSCPRMNCDATWCKKCSQLITAISEHSCDGSKELDTLIQDQNWKRCPGCETPTSKEVGCNHMRCVVPGCNTHFCYECGAEIVKSVVREEIERSVEKHYRKACTLFEVPDEDEE